MPCFHVVAACKHAHHEYKNYMYHVYKLKMSPTYTNDCLKNCTTKRIDQRVISQDSAPTQRRRNSKDCPISSSMQTQNRYLTTRSTKVMFHVSNSRSFKEKLSSPIGSSQQC